MCCLLLVGISSLVPTPHIGRRRALLNSAAVLLPLPAFAADDVNARLSAGLAALDLLMRDWKELTIDCTYAEVPKALLETKNKELLLEKASTLALFDKSTSITVCKTNSKKVRPVLEPLTKLAKALQTSSMASLVDPDDFEAYLAAAERYESAINAADSAAYLAASDYSASTAFKEGETPTTPNLDAARDAVEAAREALAAASKLARGR